MPLLVDTGMPDTARGQAWHYPSAFQHEGMSVVEQLAQAGYQPEDIGYVALTHLHWDHCSYLERFTNARFFAHPLEIAFAKDPLPLYYRAYEHSAVGMTNTYSTLTLVPVREGEAIIPE
jgi:glyoxylase-like metal-dependent hydrolase (beta-lactamase superfamily II)